ncbi:MAG: mevalonate kinase [Candidatus Bathyarchaeota archaeon]|nr:mevalonate kinase [Candidatus Bathyarchaeota archaeon]
MLGEATAPGKMILFGEHSVVYRGPAVVLAIDRRAKVIAGKRDDEKVYIDADNLGFSGYFEGDEYHAVRGKAWRGRNLAALNMSTRKTMERLDVESGVNLKVRSMIPIAVGLGSSAAVNVATVGAVQRLFDGDLSKEEISNIAFEGETIIHGKPSGVDNNVSTFGGVMSYERGKGFNHHQIEGSIPFIIGNTRKKRSTKKMVETVAVLRERNPALMDNVIDVMGSIASEGLDALLKKDLKRLGDLMNINHGLLSSIGVSTMKLETLCHTARANGALGAKLTGAGGGGCMIALAEETELAEVERAIRRRKSDSYRVSLTDRGVESRRIEEKNADS